MAKLLDRSAFAGSVATADVLVRTMLNVADVPIIDTIKMMTIVPAKVIGVEMNKGSLVSGKDADIVVFDDNINVAFVMVNGNICINQIDQ